MIVDYQRYRQSESERTRTEDLLRLIPQGYKSILDIGARDGHFTKLFAERFERVVATDLERPELSIPNVETAASDVRHLPFPDDSFDVVFCAEVLEHVSNVEVAAREIARVAKSAVVIGVPYRQDLRAGRTACSVCRGVNPPWGHINSFDEQKLSGIFSSLLLKSATYVGQTTDYTNFASALLFSFAGHPWGTYQQEERCIHCGAELSPPAHRGFLRRIAGRIGVILNRAQRRLSRPRPMWIHALLLKRAN